MTHKISIAISGAVSLGSYESGTVYEIIRALKLHNEANPNNRIEIDVLSGASAGGMTAAMIAQKLLYDGAQLEDPIDNCLYDVWVNRVDIDDLLDPNLGDNPNQSLLSSNRIRDNANYVFLKRYKNKDLKVQPHIAAGQNIKLGLALSNLNGVDYELPTFSNGQLGIEQGEFIQTRNQDRYTTDVNAQCDNETYWTEVMTAGRASGAFPLAFKALNVQRDWNTMDYKGLGAANWQGVFDGNFSYADGGIFNNYPLGLARELSLQQDERSDESGKRFYFYISPDAKVSNRDYKFNAENANILTSFGQVIKSILSNSRFQDWVEIDTINDEVNALHQQAEALLDLVLNADKEELQTIKIAAERFCQFLYPGDEKNDNADYDKAYACAEKVFSHLLTKNIELNNEQKKVWLHSILVMQMNANHVGKEKMSIYTITAEAAELASSPISAFFGFLDVRFRHHDYLVGRLKARETINSIIASVKQGDDRQLPLHIDPLETADIEAELKKMAALRDANMADVDVEVRKKLYARLKDRSIRMMKSIKINKVVCWLVFYFVLRNQLKKFLAL